MNCLRRLSHIIEKKHHKATGIINFYSQNKCNEISPATIVRSTIPTGILGQPTCHTHPHLISEGCLIPLITQKEYVERRDIFVSKLASEMIIHDYLTHFIVIPGACKQYMSDQIPYIFRQNSDFFYLTGCMEPDAALVMIKPPGSNCYKSIIFVNDKDSNEERWEGPRTGCNAAIKLFDVNEARPSDSFVNFLDRATSVQNALIWYEQKTVNPVVHKAVNLALNKNNTGLSDPKKALHEIRVIKSPAEVELMKAACEIGSEAINLAMAYTEPGVSEQNIHSILEFTSRQAGADHLAFPPVVAGGARATHIHYINNNQLLADRDLVLVDSGAQRWLYNSDISRTWPVSGRFYKHHRILYEIVLSVQQRLIQILGERRPSLDFLFDQMCKLLSQKLQQEGILPRNLDKNELHARAYRLCPHHVSHYLGLDIHDSSSFGRGTPVQNGMIVTIEPGIYISPNDHSVPPEFRGIGIRIEDDVLISNGAPIVLTKSCIKEPNEIEAQVGKCLRYTV